MRGIRKREKVSAMVGRITPAHAGNTLIPQPIMAFVGDHPRACGEYCLDEIGGNRRIGSPPRMRGILRAGRFRRRKAGITPAHAGNTLADGFIGAAIRDHPRACGEYAMPELRETDRMGSPPRMRGIRQYVEDEDGHLGITPAHAGNTKRETRMGESIGDHPRACGEYKRFGVPYLADLGSPPRMRGIPRLVRQRCRCPGITPAHAGNTMPAGTGRV